ncbi:MAG: proline dehydrogenase family protein [Gemmatimonadales bacterium]
MSLARSLLLKAADSRWLADQMSKRSFSRRAIRKFMPGETLDDALGAAVMLATQGQGSLLTQLGEALSSLDEASAVRDHYLHVFSEISRRALPAWISIKPTQLGIDQSMATCREHLLRLAEAAAESGSSLWIDMEDHSYVDRTLELYAEVKQRHERTGLAIQAYLFRTPKDIETLLPLKPWIRLVKGAYREPPTVAFPAKRDVDAAYYDLAVQLLEAARTQQALAVFGTHDVPLVERLRSKAASLGVSRTDYEIHMLYGIKASDQARLTREGETIKTLISYGHAWFKWYMRRLAERPANVWFAVKSIVA